MMINYIAYERNETHCDRISDDRRGCPYEKIAVGKPEGEKASQQLVHALVLLNGFVIVCTCVCALCG